MLKGLSLISIEAINEPVVVLSTQLQIDLGEKGEMPPEEFHRFEPFSKK